MNTTRSLASLAFLSLTTGSLLIACAERQAPTELSSAHVADIGHLAVITPTDGIKVPKAKRGAPLTSDITVSKIIGANGGSIGISAAGFKMIVPRGAVDRDITFRVTAVAGGAAAYEFEPHGLTFLVPITVTQYLDNYTLTGLEPGTSFDAGYFADRTALTATDSATVTELRSAALSKNSVSFSVSHFSGYVLSSGRK